MDVCVINQQETLLLRPSVVEALASAVIEFEGIRCDEVSIHFVDVAEISDLHSQFFNDPSPTDCISFPMDEEDEGGYRVLGDVFVCPEVAFDYAKQNNHDPLREITLYIVHGLLHLMGYDDIQDIDISEMRAAEQRHMDHLKALGLWLKL